MRASYRHGMGLEPMNHRQDADATQFHGQEPRSDWTEHEIPEKEPRTMPLCSYEHTTNAPGNRGTQNVYHTLLVRGPAAVPGMRRSAARMGRLRPLHLPAGAGTGTSKAVSW
jgi:hypothetical protein